MTKEEINQFIYDKQLPLSFTMENDVVYSLICFNGDYGTTTHSGNNSFPEWVETNNNRVLIHYTIFKSTKDSFKECLSEFLYWFEINKHKYKDIKYYEKS